MSGSPSSTRCEAAGVLDRRGVPVTVVDPRWTLPVDAALVQAAAEHRLVVTVEDNGVAGGFGDAFCRALRDAQVSTDVRTLGLTQAFLPHANRADVLAEHGLDAAGLVAAMASTLASTPLRPAG